MIATDTALEITKAVMRVVNVKTGVTNEQSFDVTGDKFQQLVEFNRNLRNKPADIIFWIEGYAYKNGLPLKLAVEFYGL